MKRAWPRWLSAGLAAMPSGVALAAEAAPASSSTFGALFQALLGLAVVFALMYAFFWLLRRYGPTQMGAQGAVKVVGGVMLGPRERLVVVEVQDTWLLVGVASGHVGLLHRMDKPADLPAMPAPNLRPFADRLAEIVKRPGKG
jgi:flagellar protein FliO/FliZ